LQNLESKPSQSSYRLKVIRVLALLFVVALTVVIFLFRDRIRHLEGYGYLGVFLISVLAYATVIIPLPGVVITTAMGAVFNPLWVAVAAGSGAGIGELTGYLAGFSGQAVVEQAGWYERIEKWMRKYGDPTILILAAIPNPLFDVVGIVAGVLKMPIYRFLFWAVMGNIIKMLFFAYGGALGVRWLGI